MGNSVVRLKMKRFKCTALLWGYACFIFPRRTSTREIAFFSEKWCDISNVLGSSIRYFLNGEGQRTTSVRIGPLLQIGLPRSYSTLLEVCVNHLWIWISFSFLLNLNLLYLQLFQIILLAFLQISYISIFYISNFISILPIFKLLFKLMKRFILKGVTKQKFCSMKFDIFLDIFSSWKNFNWWIWESFDENSFHLSKERI